MTRVYLANMVAWGALDPRYVGNKPLIGTAHTVEAGCDIHSTRVATGRHLQCRGLVGRWQHPVTKGIQRA